jgi:hypothetical protein
MIVNLSKSITLSELLIKIKICYPDSLSLIEGPFITLDIKESVKYSIWLKKPNLFEVIPQKAIWNRSFEMKVKAQEISLKLKDYIENGVLESNSGTETPITCPSCRCPNPNKLRICDWCGAQII